MKYYAKILLTIIVSLANLCLSHYKNMVKIANTVETKTMRRVS